jgi:histidinol-phosphatase (PHP family)
MGDYHVHLHPHTWRAGDPDPHTFPQDHIDRYVEHALQRGLTEICFTEHLYRLVEAESVLGEFWKDERPEVAAPTIRFVTAERTFRIDDYVTAVLVARDRGLPVLLGLEIDFFPESIDAVVDLIAPYPWDLLVGAVHWVGGFAIDHDGLDFEFARRGVDRVFEAYFALETQLAASGTVDVLAHADKVKRNGHVATEPLDQWYEAVADAAASTGTAVEISTAGLLQACAELYPGPDFLAAFHRAGVGITLASDTHRPDGVGHDFDVGLSAARAAGYAERLTFRGRVATAVPLEERVGPAGDG